MENIFISIYSFFSRRRGVYAGSLLLIFIALILCTLSLNYNEDIYDFLPLDKNHRKSMAVYQKISAGDNFVMVFQSEEGAGLGKEEIAESIDCFNEILSEKDSSGIFGHAIERYDYDALLNTTEAIYENIPFCLSQEDYTRLDTLLTEQYIKNQLVNVKQLLMFPTGNLLTSNIVRDPLNLFTPVLQRLQSIGGQLNYELVDGYLFLPEHDIAIGLIPSPFGGSETKNNATAIELLESVIQSVEESFYGLSVHITGSPAIAVGNASQIKKDSILAIALSVIFILALLLYSFRKWKTLFLIVLSISFGWLFAMSAISIAKESVSLIVLGIASVIIGIAVNYPMHMVAHYNHTPSVKNVLKDIVSPLLIGNITTVGAFLCLVPMKAHALQDLGLFSSFMLVGTIIFVLVYLPLLLKRCGAAREHLIFPSLSGYSFESKKWTVAFVIVATLVFGYFGRYAGFNVNMNSINYMSAQQKKDMEILNTMLGEGDKVAVYVVSEGKDIDQAISKSEKFISKAEEKGLLGSDTGLKTITSLVPSEQRQRERLALWNSFVEEKKGLLLETLPQQMRSNGFNVEAFSSFFSLFDKEYRPGEAEALHSLDLCKNFIFGDTGSVSVVDVITLEADELETTKQSLAEIAGDSFFFDIRSISNAISQTLSDDFDYICYMCGFIVFIFLWISFRRVEIAVIAFLPMVISWVWILGIMGIVGIEFNIVNIILATFIFGQGDDYTIFITDGLIHEYKYGGKILSSYKNSIMLSALIMFVGIGTLIFAKHPALRSLAEVTLVGMASVVLVSYIVPPVLFRFLTGDAKTPRVAPLTLAHFGRLLLRAVLWPVQLFAQAAGNKELCQWIAGTLSGYRISVCSEVVDGPVLVLYEQKSSLDKLLACSLFSKVKFCKKIDCEYIAKQMEKGCTVVSIYNSRNVCRQELFGEALRCSQKLNLKLLILSVYGAEYVAPLGSMFINRGMVGAAITDCNSAPFESEVHDKKNPLFYKEYVLGRYTYKGVEIERLVRSNMKKYDCYKEYVGREYSNENIVVLDDMGYGEIALFIALANESKRVFLFSNNEESLKIMGNLARIPENLTVLQSQSEFARITKMPADIVTNHSGM